MSKYIPDAGDLIWLNFTPQSGREQAGKRPALVLTPKEYNKKTSLAVCIPITSQTKGYPFEVKIQGKKINGVALSDHLKNCDWVERKATYIEKANPEVMNQCLEKLSALLGMQ